MNENNRLKNVLAICFFSISMAALESAVVVYLRRLYYPEKFTVSMQIVDKNIILIELLRELATIIMLLCIGYVSGKNFKERFAYFLISFAIWDIFYYLWLKIFIDWPISIFDWDILFLIPVVWLGPVLAPVICSFTMVLIAFLFLRNKKFNKIKRQTYYLFCIGSSIILFSFTQDYLRIINDLHLWGKLHQLLEQKSFVDYASGYLPDQFNWSIFFVGELFILSGIIIGLLNHKQFYKVKTHKK
jgi:hypothetical protein